MLIISEEIRWVGAAGALAGNQAAAKPGDALGEAGNRVARPELLDALEGALCAIHGKIVAVVEAVGDRGKGRKQSDPSMVEGLIQIPVGQGRRAPPGHQQEVKHRPECHRSENDWHRIAADKFPRVRQGAAHLVEGDASHVLRGGRQMVRCAACPGTPALTFRAFSTHGSEAFILLGTLRAFRQQIDLGAHDSALIDGFDPCAPVEA
jgi:hypothetical protein